MPFLFKWGLGIQISVRVENSTLTTADAVELHMQLTTTASGRLCFTCEYVFMVYGVRALFFAFVAALLGLFVVVGFVFMGFMAGACLPGPHTVGVFAYSARLLSLLVSSTTAPGPSWDLFFGIPGALATA